MKVTLLILTTLFAAFTLAAVVRTVDNNIPSFGQYNNIDSAYADAQDGDTLYVYPSPIDYGAPYIGKRLIVIGGGVNPANPGLITSKLSPVVYYASGSNSVFIGLDVFNGAAYYPASFANCRFNNGFTVIRANTVFEDCLFTGIVWVGDNVNDTANILFRGCTFVNNDTRIYLQGHSSIACYNSVFKGSNQHTFFAAQHTIAATFNHCLFINPGPNPDYLATGETSTSTILYLNSIFETMGSIPASATFQYNIFEGSPAEVADPTNMLGVNLGNVMIDVSGGNYHLSAGSLAAGAGLYGEDIGIYGGPSPFDDLWYASFLPSITDLDAAPYVDQNGLLNVHIQAEVGN